MWIANRLQGIFFAVSVGKITDESRDNIIKSSDESKKAIYDLMSIFKTEENKVDRKQADNNNANYITALNSYKDGAYSSMDELIQAMGAINETIKNANARTNQ